MSCAIDELQHSFQILRNPSVTSCTKSASLPAFLHPSHNVQRRRRCTLHLPQGIWASKPESLCYGCGDRRALTACQSSSFASVTCGSVQVDKRFSQQRNIVSNHRSNNSLLRLSWSLWQRTPPTRLLLRPNNRSALDDFGSVARLRR